MDARAGRLRCEAWWLQRLWRSFWSRREPMAPPTSRRSAKSGTAAPSCRRGAHGSTWSKGQIGHCARWPTRAPITSTSTSSGTCATRTEAPSGRCGATPTDGSLLHAMEKASSLGMTPAITQVVRTRDGTWQGFIDPRDRHRWYESYRRMTRHYAQLANKGGAGMMVLCAELETMTSQTRAWLRVIREARERFDGKLTCSANAIACAERVRFWNKLDYIGISAYMFLSGKPNPSVHMLVRPGAGSTSPTSSCSGDASGHRSSSPRSATEAALHGECALDQRHGGLLPGAAAARLRGLLPRLVPGAPVPRRLPVALEPGSQPSSGSSDSPRGKSAERVMRRWSKAR